ncbi:hypothetical protein QO010_004794 [Caulobacter ginsengisoli]|uniref:Uncharacterized protein n=1 Tax=Caulobacter ginsengisoli TaxID=400775 RepID=A0ABU0J196_9CAUL|nr:hypothetical protein [Caulobacter ginsengisoli]MDQ0466997.1 hypothetical protein [Caulobacter ginsengisoli]
MRLAITAAILTLLAAGAARAVPPPIPTPAPDAATTAQVLQKLTEGLTPESGGGPNVFSFRAAPRLMADTGLCRRTHLRVFLSPAPAGEALGEVTSFSTSSDFVALADHPGAASCADLDTPGVVYFWGSLGDDYAVDGYRLFKRMQAELPGSGFKLSCAEVPADRCAAQLADLSSAAISMVQPCRPLAAAAVKLACYHFYVGQLDVAIHVSGDRITWVELFRGPVV